VKLDNGKSVNIDRGGADGRTEVGKKVPWVVKLAEECLERGLGLEHGANIAALIYIAAYYVVFVLLIVPDCVDGVLVRSSLYVILICLNFSVTVGVFHLHSHRKIFGPSKRRTRDIQCRSLRYRVLNRLLELVLTFPSLGTLSDFEVFHIDQHHRFNNSDRDFASTRGYERGWRAIWYWLKFAARVRFFVLKRLYLVRAQPLPHRLKRHRVLMALDLTVLSTFVIILTLVWPQRTIVYWWIPAFLTAINAGFFSWITHAPAKGDESVNGSINTVNNVMNVLMLNQGYHAIHHECPGLHWTEIPDKLQEMFAVEDKYIVPYWVTLFAAWRVFPEDGFVDAPFGRRWKSKLTNILQSGHQPRLKWLPYFAWV